MRWIIERKDKRDEFTRRDNGLVRARSSRGDDEIIRPGERRKRARYNGIRHISRCFSRNCNTRNSCVPSSFARTMERHCRRHQRLIRSLVNRSGQSTVEFAVVTAGFLAVTVALSVLWHAIGDGLLVDHAIAVASHHVQAVAPTTITDIFLY